MLYIVGMLEHLLHLCGQSQKLVDYRRVFALADSAENVAKVQTQHIQQHKLGAVGLGSGYRYLRSCPCVKHIVRLACNGAADNIDYRKNVCAKTFRLAQSRHGVKRFTRLAYDDDKRAFVNKGV